MLPRHLRPVRYVTAAWLSAAWAPAHAQFAVIDVASVTQLVHEVATLSQQLQTARQQLSQAQSLYQSMSGNRGMQQLLGTPAPNYLPVNSLQLLTAAQGGASGYPALDLAVAAAQQAMTVLSPQQVATLAPAAQSTLIAGRQSAALLQGLSGEALVNSSAQFAGIQQLLSAVGATNDQKGVLELQATLGAEQALLADQQTKLQVLYQAALAQRWTAEQQQREQAIAAQGDFASRFEPAPQ